MFKNKKIEMRLIDTKNVNPDLTVEATPTVDYVQLVRDTTETVAANVILGVAVYVAVDTLRQVIVKLTPTR